MMTVDIPIPIPGHALPLCAGCTHRTANLPSRPLPENTGKQTRLFASVRRCEKPLGRSASPRDGGAWAGELGWRGR